MLEDQSIQHLISWSNSAESFVMSPSNDFSKVLSYVYDTPKLPIAFSAHIIQAIF